MIEEIKKLVEAETGIQDISVSCRKTENVAARVMFTILAQRHLKLSYEKIADVTNRNHSSINHDMKTHDMWVRQPNLFSSNLESIRGLDQILEATKEDYFKTTKDVREEGMSLLVMFKKKNALLVKEIEELTRVVLAQNEHIERLKKYEPIW